MSHKALLAASLAAGLALYTQVCSAEDKYDHQSCYAGPAHVIQHADGMVSVSYDVTGMMMPGEGGPFGMLSGHCVGSFTIISSDYNETGGCEYWNAAGDKFFGIYARKGDPAKAEGTWRVVHGTGKFAGMSMEGKWMPNGTFPPVPNVGSSCNHEWGTYGIK